ncbi:MAG: sigma 54-interacting transcriptional regulator [candidate division Zixibacteria bacterium]|nr:sigma 54-interacting transcriptional regulator [candidate division Zixibacteria bacterium]MDH3936509.1 sigma 54-interacting transcriptional regulator [candidate division Zixibacteria bacterium]
MNTTPTSKKYEFITPISENALCQSWQARDRQTGEIVYVKTPSQSGPLELQASNRIIARSFANQRSLRTPKILTARAKHFEANTFYVEYPYLDNRIWKPLTADRFVKNPIEILTQISTIVDYLHLSGLVHGDLKFGNFLIDARPTRLSIILIDLDFLCEANEGLQAQVFGTPEHIAPEVIANRMVVPQSDNYSLGVSLQKVLEELRAEPASGDTDTEDTTAGAERLAVRLVAEEWSQRPAYLTSALFEEGLIDRRTFESSQKSLFGMKSLSDFRLSSHRQSARRGLAKTLLSAKNMVMGLSDELLTDLGKAYEVDRQATFRVARKLLEDARIERFGDYWHIAPSDSELKAVFRSANNICKRDSGELVDDSKDARPQLNTLIQQAADLKQTGELYKALFILKECEEITENEPEANNENGRTEVLRELVEVSYGLNRPKDASHYSDQLLELLPKESEEYLSLLHEQTVAAINTKDTEKLQGMIQFGFELASDRSNSEYKSKFDRLRAWQYSLNGDHKSAEQILSSLLQSARKSGWCDQAVLIGYAQGVVEWRRGDFIRSEMHLLEAFSLAKSKNITIEQNPVTAMLTLLYSELAEYDKAVKYGKLAIRNASTPRETAKLQAVYTPLMFGFVRLGEFRKAEYWLQKYLNFKFASDQSSHLMFFYLNRGFLQGNMGDLTAAKQSWQQALEIPTSNAMQKPVGKVHQNLAEVALFQGDIESCREHIKSAISCFAPLHDTAALAEVELINCLGQVYYEPDPAGEALLTCARTLVENNCLFCAGICLFHLLIRSDTAIVRDALEIATPLVDRLEKSKSPVLKAVSMMVRFAKYDSHETAERLGVLKSVYRILDKAGQKFLTLLICQQLALIYEDGSNPKLAQKFYAHALKIAEALGNSLFSNSIQERLDKITPETDNRDRLISSLHGISEALSSIDDYEGSLRKMVGFAVEQTGAERGALLLKKSNKQALQVGAFLHCDEESLADIQAISSRIPQDAMNETKSIIIENALADPRTKEYQSIIYHNILSVACLPIVRDNEQIGALYLDHHTIPALFDAADIMYMESIANFMSVMLTTAQRYKASNLAHEELLGDLNRLGNEQSFVTVDPVIQQLLSRLPEIARSEAPVLITGESGTGKEILASLIHNLSVRADQPMIKMNCSAIAHDLIESELFGVAKNVATGVGVRDGKFSAADNGTLLLDEIGDMAIGVQAKLLRVLEYQQFEKVGSNRTISVDIRFLYSTNKNLRQAVKDKEFREDLLHRLNTFTIEIPPLRERQNDIPVLVDHFIRIFSAGKVPPRIQSDVMDFLIAYAWSGNVRELKNTIERLCILYPGQRVAPSMLPLEIYTSDSKKESSKKIAEAREKAEIIAALIKCDWVQSRVAKLLGMSLATLRRKIKKYGISRD